MICRRVDTDRGAVLPKLEEKAALEACTANTAPEFPRLDGQLQSPPLSEP